MTMLMLSSQACIYMHSDISSVEIWGLSCEQHQERSMMYSPQVPNCASLTDQMVHKSALSELVSTKCAQVDKQSDLKISEKELLYRQSNDNHLCWWRFLQLSCYHGPVSLTCFHKKNIDNLKKKQAHTLKYKIFPFNQYSNVRKIE